MPSNKEKYSSDDIYKPDKIVASIPDAPNGPYAESLLWEKFALLKKYLFIGPILDLCCGNAKHIVELPYQGQKIGLDFSNQFLTFANNELHAKASGVSLVRGDAITLPFKSSSINMIYSFSSLYHTEEIHKIFKECNRALNIGGHAIFDLGNKYSLNRYCCGHYPELAQDYSISITGHLAQCRAAGFEIVEHRSFQIIPLWCDRPKWLWPLLHPVWTKIMAKRIRGKMLDEWISSLPILRHFAFRHLVVCRKPSDIKL